MIKWRRENEKGRRKNEEREKEEWEKGEGRMRKGERKNEKMKEGGIGRKNIRKNANIRKIIEKRSQKKGREVEKEEKLLTRGTGRRWWNAIKWSKIES